MPQSAFDDPVLRSGMARYLQAAKVLDEASDLGAGSRELLDLAEAKAMAGMGLRKRLGELGWSAPVRQRSST